VGVVTRSGWDAENLTHEGSNGYWVAAISIYPKEGTIVLLATNFGGRTGQKSIEDLASSLASHLNLTHRGLE
jgi:hypothetical protein